MLRQITGLLAAAALLVTAPAAAAARSGGDTRPAAAEDVVVVGEPILAANAFGGAVARATAAGSVAAAGCRDAAYALAPWQLPSRFAWQYNQAGAPASVASTALGAVRNGTRTLFQAGYRCGGTTALRTTEAYTGLTTRRAQVSANATCTGNDGVSVTSWGSLPPGVLAYTCVYYRTSSRTVLASDTLIDNKRHRWFTTRPARCSGQFDLQSVMVHERGHTAGLEHVDQRAHASQTMAPKTMACTTTNRTLGAGDVRGLVAKYRR